MTKNEEHLTQNGELFQEQENVLSFNKEVSFCYSRDTDSPDRLKLKMDFPKQSMPVFQMIFLLKGSAELVINEESQVHARIESQQHNLLCTDSLSSGIILKDATDHEIFCINLSSSFLNRYLPHTHPARQCIGAELQDQQLGRLFTENMFITAEMAAILQGIGRLSHTGFCNQLIVESKAINLLALQISQFEQLQSSEQPSALKKEELERMQRVREILLSQNDEKLSLRSLAHRVGTNEFTLKRNFKLAFGNTVYGYLNQYKMEQAKALLIDKDITIAELSVKMGYKYPTHFSTAFKKYFGYLPNKLTSGKMQLLLLAEYFSGVLDAMCIAL